MDKEAEEGQKEVADPYPLKKRRGSMAARLFGGRRGRGTRQSRFDCAGLMHDRIGHQRRERPSVAERTLFISG
jgi:hypothetical protein